MENHQNKLLCKYKHLQRRIRHCRGYSIKKIGGHEYLYVWETTGHGKAKWKCLGRLDKSGEALLMAYQRQRINTLIDELNEVRQKLRNMNCYVV